MISYERLRELLDYDRATGIFIWRVATSSKVWPGKVAGFLGGGDDGQYLQIGIDRRMYYAHRLAWFYVYKEWPAGALDHRDGNKQNNAIDNLRLANTVQNAGNAKLSRRNKTGFKGVQLHHSGRYYKAGIGVNNGFKHLGYFKTAKEAHMAYLTAARGYFGDFARG